MANEAQRETKRGPLCLVVGQLISVVKNGIFIRKQFSYETIEEDKEYI